jgi:hypothetical protein
LGLTDNDGISNGWNFLGIVGKVILEAGSKAFSNCEVVEMHVTDVFRQNTVFHIFVNRKVVEGGRN